LAEFVLRSEENGVVTLSLNRPSLLNAWHKPMRDELVAYLTSCGSSEQVGAIVLTGVGSRAFSAGQDLNEARHFDADRAEEWIREWETLYGVLRNLEKPVVVALNGLAAGSAFQVALLADMRIGHANVTMGQPEINSGIASVTGPWILRELVGMARTIDLVLTGRMVPADECLQMGLLNRVVPERDVLSTAQKIAGDLAAKPKGAMRLTKHRLREMTQANFEETIAAAIRIHRDAYGSGEPSQQMERFLNARTAPSSTGK
jgi:enoyl-CoA hydratase